MNTMTTPLPPRLLPGRRRSRRNARRTLSLSLVLVLALAATAVRAADKPGSVQHLAAQAPAGVAAAPGQKPDVGTADAPVDGLDGKPHAGPFVETTKKKAAQLVEDLDVVAAAAAAEAEAKAKQAPVSSSSKAKVADAPEDDGVMSDVAGRREVSGPTGTEGGVSAKERMEGGRDAKKAPPEPPREPPKMSDAGKPSKGKPVDGAEKGEGREEEKKKGAAGLAKPADLPSKPHDIPHPKPPTVGKAASGAAGPHPGSDGDDSILHPFHSFLLSWTMIIFSEIGDKTFLIAALMAMRHDRAVVFTAAFSALALMTVLSALLGHAVPRLLPERLTHLAAALLFAAFGYRLLREGLAMSPDEGVSEEMKEVEMELEEKEMERRFAGRGKRRSSNGADSPYLLESGRAGRSTLPAPRRSPSTSPSRPASPAAKKSRGAARDALAGLENLCSLLLSPAWVQTFVMTFLGEWGDRSQIATIAMAAGQDYWWVTGGAVVGHAMCTAVAVAGGRAIAGRVSMRIVTLGGAGAFILFGIIYLAEALYAG